jgi:hypothetical protein
LPALGLALLSQALRKHTGRLFNYVEGETISVFAGAGNDHVTVDASVTTWRAELPAVGASFRACLET